MNHSKEDKPPILDPGSNVSCLAEAKHVSILIDAASYFKVLAELIPKAEKSILIVGWDLHSQIEMIREEGHEVSHKTLLELLNIACDKNPQLNIHILIWDCSALQTFEREISTSLQFGFKGKDRIHYKVASDHPVGASHHQKIVVIDDKIAFTGGIDLSIARWDTSDHLANNPSRKLPNGKTYSPFHDVQIMMDGKVAVELGNLSRERWKQCVDEIIEVPNADSGKNLWPASIPPDFEDVQVGISITQPEYKDQEANFEIQKLFEDAIDAAESFIYIENQYVTSGLLKDVFKKALLKNSGPEIVIITPEEQYGILEEITMGNLREQWVQELSENDPHKRLKLYSPFTDSNTPINVHAKVMIVDDRFIQIGSSNLSDRSMQLDTECNASIEAKSEAQRAMIAKLRSTLLAEHLGSGIEELEKVFRAQKSIIKTIENLQKKDRKTLGPLKPCSEEWAQELISPNAAVVDPKRGLGYAFIEHTLMDTPSSSDKPALPRLAMGVGLVCLLGFLGVGFSYFEWIDKDDVVSWLSAINQYEFAPFIGGLVFFVAATCMVPVLLLILASVLVFGPWFGFSISMIASFASASLGFLMGKKLLNRWLKKKKKFQRIHRWIEKKGIVSTVLVRIFPVAPFMVVNVICGSSSIRYRDYILGTMLGMLPGIAALSFASNQILDAIENPSPWSVGSAIVIAVLVVVASVAINKLFNNRKKTLDDINEEGFDADVTHP